MPVRAEQLESEAVCGAEGLTRPALPGLASGISPSQGSTWLHLELGAQQHSRCPVAPEKHRQEDRSLGWETLRADKTLTATRVFGFYWGMLQANCIGGPSLEVTAQQQAAWSVPTLRTVPRGGAGAQRAPCSAPGSFAPAVFKAAFKAVAPAPCPGSYCKQKSRPRQDPSILLSARQRG